MKKNVEELIKRHTKYSDSMMYSSDLECLVDELALEFKLNKIAELND